MGFTLAEVLITLAIIGVVAALTMPALIQKHQEQVTVTKLKKFYSTFSQAYLMAVNDNGTFDTWGLGDPEYTTDSEGKSIYTEDYLDRIDKFFETMKPYLKIIHSEKIINESIGNESTGYILADGIPIVGMWLATSQCINNKNSVCGDIYIKTDNKLFIKTDGTTRNNNFNFRIYRNKIVPTGTTDWEFNQCKNGNNRTRCTAWVIYNGNMDYLHCPDKLGWNKARSCKGK